jgi:ActR/RegA family two-component response regulator
MAATVAVADRDRTLVQRLEQELRRNGFEVLTAFSVAGALQLFETRRVDVLLAELQLGETSAVALLSKLRERYPEVRAVLMSRHVSAEEYKRALRLGAVELLTKPFEMGAMLEAVSTAADCERSFRGSLHGITLFDVLQMLHLGKRSVSLHVGDSGRVHFSEGEIIHAVCDGTYGIRALEKLLATPSGTVQTTALTTKEQTISAPFNALLLDTVRQIDEKRRDAAGGMQLDDQTLDELFGDDFGFDAELAASEGRPDATDGGANSPGTGSPLGTPGAVAQGGGDASARRPTGPMRPVMEAAPSPWPSVSASETAGRAPGTTSPAVAQQGQRMSSEPLSRGLSSGVYASPRGIYVAPATSSTEYPPRRRWLVPLLVLLVAVSATGVFVLLRVIMTTDDELAGQEAVRGESRLTRTHTTAQTEGIVAGPAASAGDSRRLADRRAPETSRGAASEADRVIQLTIHTEPDGLQLLNATSGTPLGKSPVILEVSMADLPVAIRALAGTRRSEPRTVLEELPMASESEVTADFEDWFAAAMQDRRDKQPRRRRQRPKSARRRRKGRRVTPASAAGVVPGARAGAPTVVTSGAAPESKPARDQPAFETLEEAQSEDRAAFDVIREDKPAFGTVD